MVAKVDFTIEQGATWKHSLLLKSGGETGPALNLTGYTAKMQVRAGLGATAVLLELSTVNSRIVVTAVTGRLDLTVPASVTAALSFVTAVCDLIITSPGGEVTRLFQGVVTLSLGATK